ncbi:GNAT family N-acetyltransferase [Lysobacter firmicutimachus]|uniref:GNAT family N-acetyltransferase n=1 Tax=Lysobacter firmicutimachus TaxID=1792846 RepID=A0AAU8MLY0_9GAMM|nr:GNAT family N-acetyltransferase [Lysobacter antibioticus]
MATRERLPPWHERQRLPNGREVLIRPVRPEDAEPLRAGFTLLQPDEVRQRFLYALKELTPEMAERFTRIDPRTEFALVAAEPFPPGEALVGAVARIAIDERTRDAEFAILVSRYIANMGLGRYLMTRLVKWARGKKVHRLYGEVFEHNAPMLSLAQSLGFEREFQQDSPGLIRVVLDLRAKPPSQAEGAGEPELGGDSGSDSDKSAPA